MAMMTTMIHSKVMGINTRRNLCCQSCLIFRVKVGDGMKKFEHKSQPLLTRSQFAFRFVLYALFAIGFLCISLLIGTIGYARIANLSAVDAFLNASMILTGMGPVDKMETTAGKLFASIYAIYSGVAFLTFCGVLFTPFYHRFMHKFHLEFEE
jgi:hypothetical protein